MNSNNNNGVSSQCTLPSIYIHNIRSLNLAKFNELKLIAGEYDMIFLTESWLNKNTEKVYCIPDFSLHTCHRLNRKSGGVAIYIKDNLPVTKLLDFSNEHTSVYWFQLCQPGHHPIVYGVLYHPPGLSKQQKEATLDHIITSMAKFIGKLKSVKFFICGDFNDLSTVDITTLFPLTQLVDFPTRGKNLLDLVFTDLDEYIDVGCLPEPPILNNDHCAISIPSTNRSTEPRYTTIKKHNVTPVTKCNLTNDLLECSWDFLYSNDSIHLKVELFQNLLLKLFNKNCPVTSFRVPVGKPFLSTPLIRKLSRAKKRAHRRNNPVWKYFGKLLSSQLKKNLHRHVDNNINKTVKGTKNWWKCLKSLTGNGRSNNNSPIININDSWMSPSQFVNNLNNYYLEAQHGLKLNFPDIPKLSSTCDLSVSEIEVFKLLNDIDTHKATISEDFPSWISKNNSHILCKPITYIINIVLSSMTFPLVWKRAEVLPIPKIKNPKMFKDMRPISLLFHLSKVTESIILKKLRQDIPTFSNQYAYTPLLGTTDAIVKFSSDIALALDNHNNTSVRSMMLDMSKAFDRMRPDITISKLLHLGVRPSLVAIVRDFFVGRCQCVKYQGCHSTFLSNSLGVPQGTILGPILWNVFISDLTFSTSFLKYADDITVYSAVAHDNTSVIDSSRHSVSFSMIDDHLQIAADHAVQWCKDFGMTINASKSNTISFSLKKAINDNLIYINDIALQKNCYSTLLGVTYDHHMTFSKHVDNAINKSKPSLHALISLKKSGVDRKGLIIFYRTVIRSLLSYAAPGWFPYLSNNDIDKLERFQKLCLRIILPNVEHYCDRLDIAEMDYLNVYLDVLCLRYVTKLQSNTTHPLHHYIIKKKLDSHSRRLNIVTRTSLLSKSLFYKYS